MCGVSFSIEVESEKKKTAKTLRYFSKFDTDTSKILHYKLLQSIYGACVYLQA
jgi:hypothetical protein